jgi:hypothetical protein
MAPMWRAALLVLALVLMGLPKGISAQAHPDPRSCLGPQRSGATPVQRAVACAEEFIRRNGYTSHPAADSTLLATESIEWGVSLLEGRHDSLAERAFGVCTGGGDSHAFTVVFTYREGSKEVARAVTMSREFTELRVQHVDFILRNVFERQHGCVPIAAEAAPATDPGPR